MTYQPIKRGMTEAVTRGELEAAEREGREPVANVTQLAWFDTKDGACCFGVLEGVVFGWLPDGTYYKRWENNPDDIFALPRYEWQWNIIEDGKYVGVTDWFTSEAACEAMYAWDMPNWKFERIEGSKRLVEEGMTIAGDGAAELGKLMREQHKKGGPVPHA
jgi:hypothetical protein